jgi:chaperone modulatory protein CbpM
VIEPVGQTRSGWQFTTLSIVRVAKAKRLERDLGLNLPGVALALDLLDQLDEMRTIERQKEIPAQRR